MLGGGAAEVDQPTAGAQALRGGCGRHAVERVDHQVDRPVGRAAQPVGQLRHLVGVEGDNSVGTGGERPLLRRVRAGGGDDPRGAVQPGQLDRGLADHAARAEHEDRLARASSPRQVSAMWAAMAESPSAAISVGTTPSGSGTRSAVGTAAASAMLPSPGAMPADMGNHTARPSTVPTPCTPGTYGVRVRRSTTGPTRRGGRAA